MFVTIIFVATYQSPHSVAEWEVATYSVATVMVAVLKEILDRA